MAFSQGINTTNESKFETVDIKKIQHESNVNLLNSIRKYGLRSPASIDQKEILFNPVLQTQGVDDTICVNYVNFENTQEAKEFSITLKTLVYEEYLGIYGIAAERQSPFLNFKNPQLFKDELTARLLNCIVFIAEAPAKSTDKLLPADGNFLLVPTTLPAFPKADNFYNQVRGDYLVNKKDYFINRITEIKTTYKFNIDKDIKYALVPAPLYKLVAEIFKDKPIQIISVALNEFKFNKVPQLLEYMHKEVMTNPIHIQAPAFEETIITLCLNTNIKRFVVHALRLHTEFDFMVRTIANINDNQTKNLLKRCHAHSAVEHSDLSGFIVVHKRYGISRYKMIDTLIQNDIYQKDKIYALSTSLRMKACNKIEEDTYQELKTRQNNLQLQYVYNHIHPHKIAYLQNYCAAHVIQFNKHCFAISYDQKYKAKVELVIKNFEKIDKASVKIQALYRGNLARNKVTLFRALKQQSSIEQNRIEALQNQLKDAERDLAVTKSKLQGFRW